MSSSHETKPYRLTFNPKPQYLHVHVESNTDSYELSIRFWNEIAAECKQNKWKKVLVEEDIPEDISVAEAFELASELPQIGFFGVKIAFVDHYIEQEEMNKFSEMVAVNRGLNAKIFTNTNEAEKWLLKS